MSVHVLAAVLRDSEATLGKRLVLIALADHAGDDGVSWPHHETVATKARLSRQHTVRLLGEMADEGLIEVRKAQRGRRRISVYRVLLPGLADVDYDRLPFSLDEPFTASEVLTSSEPDDVGSAQTTTSDPSSRVNGTVNKEPSGKPAPAPLPTRARNHVWDALVEIYGEPLARGKAARGRIVADLRERLAADGVPDGEPAAAEVRRRHAALTGEWSSRATARALVEHWKVAGQLADHPPRRGLSAQEIADIALNMEEEA